MPTLRLQTDEACELLANRQYFMLKLGYRWAAIVVLSIAGALLLIRGHHPAVLGLGIMSATAALLLTLAWIKAYLWSQRLARDQFARLEDPQVTIQMTEEAVEVKSSLGTRRTRWSDVTRQVETRDFLALETGGTLAALIPKAVLTDEVRAFLETHIAQAKPASD